MKQHYIDRAVPFVKLLLFFPAELAAIKGRSEFLVHGLSTTSHGQNSSDLGTHCIGRLSTCWQDLCGFGRDPLDTMHNTLGCLIAEHHNLIRRCDLVNIATTCLAGTALQDRWVTIKLVCEADADHT